jgi:soluble lytic murein transglycosylase-like protein
MNFLIPLVIFLQLLGNPNIEEIKTIEPESQVVKIQEIMPQYDLPIEERLQVYIYVESQLNNVPYELVLAMIQLESEFQIDLVCYNSKSNYDSGLMQVNSCRWPELKEQGYTDLLDPYQNVEIGVKIIGDLIERYGDETKDLQCYNQGENSAKKDWDNGIIGSVYTRKVLEYKNNYIKMKEKIN